LRCDPRLSDCRDWLGLLDVEADFREGELGRDAGCRAGELDLDAGSREGEVELGREAGCRVEALGRVASCRDDEPELALGTDRRVVVTRVCEARTAVSRNSRCSILADRSPERAGVVLRGGEVREGTRLCDEGRSRNSIGSRSDLLIVDRIDGLVVVLRATWPARFVFV
jgi:hypothetical protein